MGNFSTLEKWILWGTTIICAIIGLSIDGFLGFILLAVIAYFATKFAIKKHDERFPASLTPQDREAMKKEKEEKTRIKAEKKGNSLLNKMVENQQLAQNRKESIKRTKLKAKMKCPRCGSKNIQPAGVHKGGFSVGKADLVERHQNNDRPAELTENQRLVAYSIDPDISDEERQDIINLVKIAMKNRRRI